MKKILLTIVVLLANVLVAFADNISVADVVIPAGKTATTDIYLENTSTNLMGFQMDVTLPEGISINKAGCSLSSRFADGDQELTIGKQGNNVYRLTSTSFSLMPITGSSGKIITLSLQASSTSQGGTATISNIRFVTSNSDRIALNDVSFNINIKKATLAIKAIGNGSVNFNGTSVRNTTKTFTVDESSSATISFTPDDGYRIKSVKKDGTDVTSSVSNGQYTVSNIQGSTTVEVEFEAIPSTTYILTVKATGYGSAFYNSTTIRNTTKTFVVNEGTSATINFTPDDGYRIKSVKHNSSNVTSSVTNNEYTISNITDSESLEVEFEAIPLTMCMLTIAAQGNGAAVCEDKSIRSGSISLSIEKGTSTTVFFISDDGYRIKSVKKDGVDVTSNVLDNQYAISNLQTDISIEVEFEARPTTCTYETVNYVVQSFADMTVLVTLGDYGRVLEVPVTISFDGTSWRVNGLEKDALANSPALAAVIWHPAAAFTSTLNNPNLLLYVEEAAYAPATIGNVVVKGVADNIVLTDAASGNDFFCPQEFTARRISYSHHYRMETGMDEARGWETIALPFDVQRIVHESKGEIVPFAQRNSDDSRRPFWLMTFTDKGWTAADGIKANTPYIISMPNHPDYYSDYMLSGTVVFESENVAVMASDDMKPSQQGDKTFIPTYCEIGIGEGAFALNVSNDLEQNTSGVAEGSRFVLNMRRVHPFEAYMKSSTTRSPWIGITEDMENAVIQGDDRVGVFSLGGQLLKRCADEADALRPLRSGVYIVNRKKVIVK